MHFLVGNLSIIAWGMPEGPGRLCSERPARIHKEEKIAAELTFVNYAPSFELLQ